MNYFEIPLSPIPQVFAISLGGEDYRLTLQYRDGWILDVADDQLGAEFLRAAIAEFDHFFVVVARIDVHERERQRRLAVRAEAECLQRQMQHDDRILAAREQQRRLAAFGDQFAQDVDRLGFEPVEVAHAVVGTGGRGKGGLLERRAHDFSPSLLGSCRLLSQAAQYSVSCQAFSAWRRQRRPRESA